MAHWAELDQNNIVLRLVVCDNNDPNGDEGYQWLVNNLGGIWKKTSYNMYAGIHRLGKTEFRKNLGLPGFIYNEELDAFIPPKPYNSWTLNEETCHWQAPIAYPNDEGIYNWNESTLSWNLVE